MVAIQIETGTAVENLDAILAVEGIDLIFVGPNDLSHSLGRPPEEELRAVIDDVLATCERRRPAHRHPRAHGGARRPLPGRGLRAARHSAPISASWRREHAASSPAGAANRLVRR